MTMRVPRLAGCVGAALLIAAFAGSAAASLDSQLTFSQSTVGAGQGVQVMLTLTNTGGADVTNIVPLINVTGPATLTAPTPLTVAALTAGSSVTFVLTASPTGSAGTLLFSAGAQGDGPDVAPLRAGTVEVPPPALDAQLISKILATVGQGVQLFLTVTNTGGSAVSNLKARAWTSTSNGTNPQPATVSSLAAGAKTVFTWTVTPTAGQVGTTIAFTASAAGDAGAVSPWATSAGFLVQTAPAVTIKFTATSQTVTGGNFMIVLTASNSGQATAGIGITATAFRVSGSGTTVTPFSPSGSSTANLAGGATVIFTWTVTAKAVGTGFKISNTVFVTDANGGPALAGKWGETNTVTVVGLAALTSSLYLDRLSAAVGQPVRVRLNVRNTGGTTALNITSALLLDGSGIGGVSTPAAVAELAPNAVVTFTWTYAPVDARELVLYADATGFTQSSTGLVAVNALRVSIVLPGIQTLEAKTTFAFPSPARDATRFGYLMAEAGTVKIRVYNIKGQLAATVEEHVAAGVQSSALTTAGLAPGVYYYLLVREYDSGTSDKADLAKFVVVH